MAPIVEVISEGSRVSLMTDKILWVKELIGKTGVQFPDKFMLIELDYDEFMKLLE